MADKRYVYSLPVGATDEDFNPDLLPVEDSEIWNTSPHARLFAVNALAQHIAREIWQVLLWARPELRPTWRPYIRVDDARLADPERTLPGWDIRIGAEMRLEFEQPPRPDLITQAHLLTIYWRSGWYIQPLRGRTRDIRGGRKAHLGRYIREQTPGIIDNAEKNARHYVGQANRRWRERGL